MMIFGNAIKKWTGDFVLVTTLFIAAITPNNVSLSPDMTTLTTLPKIKVRLFEDNKTGSANQRLTGKNLNLAINILHK